MFSYQNNGDICTIDKNDSIITFNWVNDENCFEYKISKKRNPSHFRIYYSDFDDKDRWTREVFYKENGDEMVPYCAVKKDIHFCRPVGCIQIMPI